MNAIRVATKGPTLAWARLPEMGEEPPPLADFQGRPIRWDEWEIAPELTHITRTCDQCGYDGQPWVTTGLVPPAPGAFFLVLRDRKLPSGRIYTRECRVHAWPIRRLHAVRCPACNTDVVYDMGEQGDTWTVLLDAAGQASLF